MSRNNRIKSNRKKTAIGMASFYLFSLALVLVFAGVAASEEHGNDQAKKNILENFSICDGDLKTVKDGFGENVSLCMPIERIVSPWCTNNELLKAIGASDKIVAVDSGMTGVSTDLFPEFKDLPDCGSWVEPDFETILSLKPDLYIPWTQIPTRLSVNTTGASLYGIQRKRFLEEQLPGVSILCIDNNEYLGWENFLNETRMLGEVLDRQEKANEFIDFYTDCMAPIIEGTKSLSENEKPRVWITSLFSTGGKVTTQPRAYPMFEPVDLAGGDNIASELPGDGRQVDIEWIIKQNPEYIFIQIWAAGNKKSPYDQDYPISIAKEQVGEILKMPQLAQVDAVKNKRVYVIQYSHFTKGPSRAIATAYLAKLLHPESFTSLDPIKMHQEYVDRFLKINFNVTENSANFIYPYLEVL
jgi:iron complex transport system substrate-binding protein